MNLDVDAEFPGLGDFWKSLFPNWPDELINKYAWGIKIDAPKFGFANGADITGFQSWWATVVSPPAQQTKTIENIGSGDLSVNINLLNPQNQKYLDTRKWEPGLIRYQTYIIGNFDRTFPNGPYYLHNNLNFGFPESAVTPHVLIVFDNRLYYDNFAFNLSINGINIAAPGWLSNGWWMIWAVEAQANLNVAPNANAKPYQFVDTVIALHENQADNGVLNYSLLYEYQTFRDAYLKYSQQIDSSTQLVKSQSQAAVNAYRQDYNDRAQREKNDLASKKLQILQAIDNQKQTTLQNYQTQLLTAQNLKLTLNQVLHNG